MVRQDRFSLYAMVDSENHNVPVMEVRDLSQDVTEDNGCTMCLKEGMDAEELKAHAIYHVELNLLKQESSTIEIDLSQNSGDHDHTASSNIARECGISKEGNSNLCLNVFESCSTPARYLKSGMPKKTYGKPKSKSGDNNRHHIKGSIRLNDQTFCPQSSFENNNTSKDPKDKFGAQQGTLYNAMIDLPPASIEDCNVLTCGPLMTPSLSLGHPCAIASLFLVEGIDSECNNSIDPTFDPLGLEFEPSKPRYMSPMSGTCSRIKASVSNQLPALKYKTCRSKISLSRESLPVSEKSENIEISSTSQMPTTGNESGDCTSVAHDVALQSNVPFHSLPSRLILDHTQRLNSVNVQANTLIQSDETMLGLLTVEGTKSVPIIEVQSSLTVHGSILDSVLGKRVKSNSTAVTNSSKPSRNVMPFLCGICGKPYITKRNLKTHIDITHSLDPVSCRVCNKTYRNDIMLKTHMMCHTREFPYKCMTCGDGFVFFSALKGHQLKEHNIKERPFKCDLCSNAYASQKVLQRHQKTQHYKEKDKHLCSKCGKVFSRKEALYSHMIYHTPKMHLCHSCGAKYHRSHELKNHMLTHHGEKNVPCESCDALFCSQLQLKRHILVFHAAHLPQKCSHCDKSFKFPKDLKRHEILIHSINTDDTKVYHCKICNQSFLDMRKWTDHMNLHSGNRPYQCKECGVKFRNRHTLQQHKRTHLGIPKKSGTINCNLCNRKFKTVQTLHHHKNRHHRSGQEIPKFVCNICDKVYVTRSTLNQHNVSVHLGIEENSYESPIPRVQTHSAGVTQKPLKCSDCDESFPTPRLFHQHRKNVHQVDYPFACSRCDKAYATYGSLYQHIKKFHEKIKPKGFPCLDCGTVLSGSAALKYHRMVRHSTTTEEHPCKKCGKCFKYEPHLNAHKLTHLDKKDRKSYKCDLCSKVLISQWAKHVHMLIHKGIKSHVCGVCGRAFTQSGDRNKHQRKCKK